MYLYNVKTSQKSWLSRVGIVVIAAVLVEIISIVQYQQLRRLMSEEMDVRSRVVLLAMANEIGHTLELIEVTMNENLSEVQRTLPEPDSVYESLRLLIDDNPHVVGGCMAFVPDYYPSRGRLYEPYVHKVDGTFISEQIAGPGHDYTEHEAFQKVMETGSAAWSDPYSYGPDSLSFTTYSYPIRDAKGRLAAVCGLDLDLSWLGDTLNTHQTFASSFAMLLTREGRLVAGPSASRTPEAEVKQAVEILNGFLPASANPTISIRKTEMAREPFWNVAQVYKSDEVFARMRRMRRHQVIFLLLALAILAFMINRFARNEKNLRKASEEQARLGSELEVAKNIQTEMLPKDFPADIYGTLESAREVGGDIFDFYKRDGKLFFCIGDVSGKGVPAAMVMSVIHSLFRVVSKRLESPSLILRALNGELCRENDTNMFVTFFVGCLDLYSGVLYFANAGHDKPYLLDGSASLLATKANLPLGVFPDTEFVEQSCVLSPGSVLFLYTDGLTEAKNGRREAFGRPRVQEVLERCLASADMTPEKMVRSLSEAAHRFVGDAPQSDDLTMLAIRYAPYDQVHSEITLSNDMAEVSRLGDFVKDFCASLELDRKTASGLRLALEETVVNVMNYAYPGEERGPITVYANSNREEVRFTVLDEGVPFDPTAVLPADTTQEVQDRPIGGLGILLTRKLMDSVSYCRKAGKNVLSLTKSIV